MLEVLAPFAPFAALLLYALAGSFIRLFYSIYKSYSAQPNGGLSAGKIGMELLAGCVFGMLGGILLDSLGVLKVGVGLGTLLCAVLGPHAIELVAKKFGWTKKLDVPSLADDASAAPDLSPRQANALAYATKQKQRLTNTAYQRLNNVSHDAAKRDLAAMVGKGRLKCVGSNKSTYYVPAPASRPVGAQMAPGRK